MRLCLDFFLRKPFFEEQLLNGLGKTIEEHLPNWSSDLRASIDQRDRNKFMITEQSNLFEAIKTATPPKDGIGSSVLVGAYKNLSCFLYFVDGISDTVSNGFSVEILDHTEIEGRSIPNWCRRFFQAISEVLPIRYAKGYDNNEFQAKNMHEGDDGSWAVGMNFHNHLPGVYWLNCFGPEYIELIGKGKLLSAPAYEVIETANGVVMSLSESPDEWDTATYKKREQAVVDHLGPQYFFSRDDPDRQTSAPDFVKISRDWKAQKKNVGKSA